MYITLLILPLHLPLHLPYIGRYTLNSLNVDLKNIRSHFCEAVKVKLGVTPARPTHFSYFKSTLRSVNQSYSLAKLVPEFAVVDVIELIKHDSKKRLVHSYLYAVANDVISCNCVIVSTFKENSKENDKTDYAYLLERN